MMSRFLISSWRTYSLRTRALLGLWAGFLLLVAFGIHGSSTGVTAGWWAPEKLYTGYLLDTAPPPQSPESAQATEGYRSDLLMARARWIRWDELTLATPLSLSQLSHQPKFPVINTNIGIGQNMLLNQHAPVWHIATLARPATWGYFFLGAQRGLAWYWWFQPFSCFTTLYLLFEILLSGQKSLAAFGAFWFCGSAYLICWSNWPAGLTFFLALSCLSAYHLLKTETMTRLLWCAGLLSIGVSGFAMYLYPPWQVSLGYVFLLLLAGLFIRDKLHRSCRSFMWQRVAALLASLALSGCLIGAFLKDCLPDMKLMAATIYPGQRVSLGGDYPLMVIFKGMYNFVTNFWTPQELGNQTEAASFYYLFPAVILGMGLSRNLLKKLGIIGWLLLLNLAVMLFFFLVGFPQGLAKLTLLSYVPPYRADPAIGMLSIMLCMLTLAVTSRARDREPRRWENWMPWLVGALVVGFFLWQGFSLLKLTKGFLSVGAVWVVALVAGGLSYCLLAGRRRLFCGALGLMVVVTSAFFNPLATNLDHLYDSELAQQIIHLNRQAADQPLWLCYGGVNTGILVTTLGGRSLSGQHWPPQLSLWHKFDPSGFYEEAYNRYAIVQLEYAPPNQRATFRSPQSDAIIVSLSPHVPLLKELGARYVLLSGEAQRTVPTDGLQLVYNSAYGNFSIYEIRP